MAVGAEHSSSEAVGLRALLPMDGCAAYARPLQFCLDKFREDEQLGVGCFAAWLHPIVTGGGATKVQRNT